MAQISLRIDDQVKQKAESVLNDIGMSMSTAVNIYLKRVAKENRIPFELTADPFYSDANIRYLEEKNKQYKANQLEFVNHDLIED